MSRSIRFAVTRCSCGHRYGVNGNDIHAVSKRGPAKPYDGPYVSPLRSETPRDGRESSLSGSPPPGRSRSRSSQAASRVTSRRLGATG